MADREIGRKKWKKIDPHYFSILEGVYFLPFFYLTQCLVTNGISNFVSPLALRNYEADFLVHVAGA